MTQNILLPVAGFRSGLSTELQGQPEDRFRISNFSSARFYFYPQYKTNMTKLSLFVSYRIYKAPQLSIYKRGNNIT